MSETVVTAETTAKKVRRGVNNQTQAVSQLKFHEKDAAQNGLFVGQLKEVKVDYSVANESTSFSGLNMPRLTFHFASTHANEQEKRHVYQSLFPVESNISTIPGGSDEWRVNNVFNWIKHILDVYYLKGRQLTDAEEDALALDFTDFDDEGNYVSVEPQDVLNAYAKIFNNVVMMLEGKFNIAEGETPKPYYKDANGKLINVWMKLLRHRKTKKGWINVGQNGELGFDSFVGAGAIEIQKPNVPPTILYLDLSKESITPKEVKKQPTIGNLANPMGGVIAGGMPTMPMDNSAFAGAAVEDMPF